AHCFKCHGLEARKAGLDLRSVGMMVRGGDNGAAIVRGSAAESMLFERIADRSMPPEKELPLSDDKIELFRRWLDGGAATLDAEAPPAPSEAPAVTDADRQFWSFQKPQRAVIPHVRQAAMSRTPIDAFVLARLEEKSLGLSPEADRRTLIRRAAYDLLGLPPTIEQVEEFLDDHGETAYERTIDRLLASPHFGERWGRHWLDAAGYVDTIGDDTDAAITKVSTGKWLYRDYVISSFNEDQPFDRFVIEQMAGDELVDWRSAEVLTERMKRLLVATGMLRTAADETLQNELNTADIREAVLEHTMEVVGSNLLGLTVNCARCHSHKFDPIPQEDYYRMLAIFAPAFNPQSWLQPAQRELPDISSTEKARAEAHNAQIDKQVAECNEKLAALRKPYEDRLSEARLAEVPEPIRADTKAALETPAEKRSDIQKYLAEKFAGVDKVSPEEVGAALSPNDKANADSTVTAIAGLNAQRRAWGTIQAVYDVGPPPPTYLLRRGDLDRPGAEVAAGFLRVLCQAPTHERANGDTPYSHTSGRRLAFAQWLTQPDSAAAGLVARVYVNRVWQYLFGQGIVATSDNFGRSGASPTHPELLDWLAVEFQSNGWRVKPLVKLIMQSSVYRQASQRQSDVRTAASGDASTLDPELIDPDNELLWRMRLRQMESEGVRDAILSVSGQLADSIGGPPVMIEGKSDGAVIVKADGNAPQGVRRRSMYLLARRRYNLSFLEAFDRPELTSNCTRRASSAVVSQSLTLLNDDFIVEQAAAMATRVARDGDATNGRICHAFQIVLARLPSADELRWADELLAKQHERYRQSAMPPEAVTHKALAHLCQMLINTNEFLYIP
ncbi:MAG: PSD1 and planctomycete cytochrome C domain-containing protein, partial [Pirellulales bacterium]